MICRQFAGAQKSPGCTSGAPLWFIVNRPAGRIADQLDGVAEGVVEIDAFGAVAVLVDGDAGLFARGGKLFFAHVNRDVRRVLLGAYQGELGAADVEERPGVVLIEHRRAEM